MKSPAERIGAALSGRYDVERELGAGGMATVYLAHDVRHERPVAVKVLHPDLAATIGIDRFLSEIRTMARLQHPHLLPLLDSGEADGLPYYVMPFVEGESLRVRLDRERQLPLADAVRIAREVAGGLDYAHRQGVIHRDIKPENILLHEGQALIADFGIALAVSAAGGGRLTQTGLSLGTPQYMAPEQAMGEKQIDQRADIYALGAVTYEMLVGEPPFTGPTIQAIVARIMTDRARPLVPQRPSVPAHLEAAVLTALEKLPADRFGSAAEMSAALGGETTTATSRASVTLPGERRTSERWRTIALVAIGAAAVSTGFAIRPLLHNADANSPRVVRFHIPVARASDEYPWVSIAPAGDVVAITNPSSGPEAGIYLRHLNQSGTVLLPGTAGARAHAFSPDGSQIAYVGGDHVLRVQSLSGGPSVAIAQGVDASSGIDWGVDDQLYFTHVDSFTVQRVPSSGGASEQLGTLDSIGATSGYRGQRAPRLLPNRRGVLYSVYRGPGRDTDLGVIDLRARTSRLIGQCGPVLGMLDNHVLCVRGDGMLLAIPFDENRLELRGDAIPLLPNVMLDEFLAQAALSPSGTLVFAPALSGESQLVWVDRAGRESPVNPELRRGFDAVAISSRGDRIALSTQEPDGTGAIWSYDIAAQTLSRLTRDGALSFRPVWTPDGSQIVFASDRSNEGNVRQLWMQSADGTGAAELLVGSRRHAQEVTWRAASDWIVYREGYDDGATLRDIRYRRTGADTTTYPYAVTRADEYNPALSPDARWLAFVSNESGRHEVYVAPFPGPGNRTPISTLGGNGPVWAHKGLTLFYRSPEGAMMQVDLVASGQRLTPIARRTLFDATPYLDDRTHPPYDVAADDQRFLMIKPPGDLHVEVVLNWWREAQERVNRRPAR